MKHSFTVLGLFLILCVSLFAQQALSQTGQLLAQAPGFNPSSLVDPNTGLPSGVEEQITVQQVPTIPKPGESVSVRLTSYLTDLNKATISWSVNGSQISSQVGATTFQFRAPESGKTTVVTIRIAKEGGGVVTRTLRVSPADVDLIYEAQTYAHPFYKGKKQYTSESVITFIAVPNFTNSNGTAISPSNLVYTWKVNGTVQQGMSGYGRNTFTTRGSLIERVSQITVEVSAVNSTLKASQTIGFKSTDPQVVVYENNPVLGIMYNKAIEGTFLLERPQVDFEGVPYFFSGEYKDDLSFDYSWTINGTRVESKQPNENYLVLRNDKNEEGRAMIGVTLNHVQNLLQTTSASLELDFKKVENEPNEEFNF